MPSRQPNDVGRLYPATGNRAEYFSLSAILPTAGGGGGGGGGSSEPLATSVTARYFMIQVRSWGSWVEAALQYFAVGLSGNSFTSASSAFASSQYDASYSADKVLTDNGDAWVAATSTVSQWLVIDYGSAVPMNAVRLTGRGGGILYSFNILYSDVDSGPYTQLFTVNSRTSTDAIRQNQFTDISASSGATGAPMWRIVVTSTGATMNLAEVVFLDSSSNRLSGPNSGWVSARDDVYGAGAYSPEKVFDDTASSFYDNSHLGNEWLEFDFKQSVNPSHVQVIPRAGPTNPPYQFQIQKSRDGAVWTTVSTLGSTSWTNSGQVFTL